MIRLKSVTVRGFRSFGAEPQSMQFASNLTVVVGPNSQGKTTLAEAIEFLFTGATVRRDLLASGVDEFADSLRNVHLEDDTDVYVEAEVQTITGEVKVLRRTLIEDYKRRSSCNSKLEIDGVPATEEDVASLGMVYSQAPLIAPVLTQHTLGYLFSAKPQERSTYFKAILEVSDLEEFRAAVSDLQSDLTINNTTLTQYELSLRNEKIKSALEGVETDSITVEFLEQKSIEVVASLLTLEPETFENVSEARRKLKEVLR